MQFLPFIITWLLNRAKEPSTYAGIAVATGAAYAMPTDIMDGVQHIIIGLLGIVSIIMNERKE